MKKRKIIASTFSLATILSVAGCACAGDKTVESLTIESGLDYTYMIDSDYSFDDIKVKVQWNDGSITYISDEDLTISEFSTATAGTKKVTFSYKGKSVEVPLKVTANADEVYQVNLFGQPLNLNNREGNLDVSSNLISGFNDKDDIYVVGDDNNFYFRPDIQYLDPETQIQQSFEKYTSVSTLYKMVGNNFVELKEEENTETNLKVSTYVDIDEENSAYDFTPKAIGETFKLVVKPKYFPIGPNGEEYKQELIFEVVDGFNVHKAVELGVMTNYDYDEEKPNAISNVNVMKNFLENNHVIEEGEAVPHVKGIVLHDNLTITRSDLPEEFFVQDGQGKYWMQDWLDIYCHFTKPGEKFTFYGNYFKIDLSQLPKVAPSTITGNTGFNANYSHTQLFRFRSDSRNYSFEESEKAYSVIENLTFTGNSQNISYSEDDNLSPEEIKQLETEGLRGVMLYKAQYHDVSMNNVLANSFYITGNAGSAGTILNLYNYKSSDSYQNHIFIWGDRDGTNDLDIDGHQTSSAPGPVINISNSILNGAGGPAIMAQHDYEAKKENANSYPTINIDAQSKIDTEIFGGEAWFTTVPFAAASFPSIISIVEGLQTVINDTDAFNFVKYDEKDPEIRYINFHTFTMTGGDVSEGYVSGLNGEINFEYIKNDETQEFSASLADGYAALGANAGYPALATSDAIVIYKGNFVELEGTIDDFKNAKYINLFYMGMMITIKSFN